MKYVKTDLAPQPGGHYSQAIQHNGWLFISGQLAVDPKTGEQKLDSIESQTRQVLANMEAIAVAAGSSLNEIMKVTIYLSDLALWGQVNEIYRQFFGDHKPARAIIPCQPLHHGFLIEVEAIAAVSGD